MSGSYRGHAGVMYGSYRGPIGVIRVIGVNSVLVLGLLGLLVPIGDLEHRNTG